MLLVDAQALAAAVGAVDWGTLVGQIPAIPDVRRPALIDPLLAAFPAAGTHATRRVTLVGPSGIGKSSAAALYISERADAYDFIGWIDCETSYSILASFERVLSALQASPSGTTSTGADEARQAVQRALSRLTGRWLLIFDNVGTVRQTEPWIPVAAGGDVIITTLNAATHPGAGPVVQVTVMERRESLQLLGRRLHFSAAEETHNQQVLDRMAAELGDWPLALELAASYLRTCGIGLDDADHYLTTLKLRSLTDEDSVPPGYPGRRTLAAALNMCIDQLQQRADPRAEPDVADVALQMLYTAAYLASHQIPAHLLLAATLSTAADLPDDHRHLLLVPPEMINVGEALRELSRFSLIKNDLLSAYSCGCSTKYADMCTSLVEMRRVVGGVGMGPG